MSVWGRILVANAILGVRVGGRLGRWWAARAANGLKKLSENFPPVESGDQK